MLTHSWKLRHLVALVVLALAAGSVSGCCGGPFWGGRCGGPGWGGGHEGHGWGGPGGGPHGP